MAYEWSVAYLGWSSGVPDFVHTAAICGYEIYKDLRSTSRHRCWPRDFRLLRFWWASWIPGMAVAHWGFLLCRIPCWSHCLVSDVCYLWQLKQIISLCFIVGLFCDDYILLGYVRTIVDWCARYSVLRTRLDTRNYVLPPQKQFKSKR